LRSPYRDGDPEHAGPAVQCVQRKASQSDSGADQAAAGRGGFGKRGGSAGRSVSALRSRTRVAGLFASAARPDPGPAVRAGPAHARADCPGDRLANGAGTALHAGEQVRPRVLLGGLDGVGVGGAEPDALCARRPQGQESVSVLLCGARSAERSHDVAGEGVGTWSNLRQTIAVW